MSGYPAFGTAGTLGSATTGTSIAPALPASLSAGDIMVGVVGTKNNATHSWPAGWTKLGQTNSGASWTVSWAWRKWQSGDTAPSVTWTGSVVNCGQILRYTHGSSVDTFGTPTAGTTSPHTSGGITTTIDHSVALYIDASAANTALTTPSGYTSRASGGVAGGTAIHIDIGDKNVTVNGTATGSISTAGAGAAYVQVQLCINPGTTTALPATWDPSQNNNFTLSNGNLKATGVISVDQGVRSTNSHSSGKYYAEFTANLASGSDGIGIATPTWDLTRANFTVDTTNFCWLANGQLWFDNQQMGTPPTIDAWTTNPSTIRVAWDLDNKKFWGAVGSGAWNNGAGGAQDPGSGQGGVSFSSITGGPPFYLAFGESNGNGNITGNFGASNFSFGIPDNFTAWDGSQSNLPVHEPYISDLPVRVLQPDRSFFGPNSALLQTAPAQPPPVPDFWELPRVPPRPDYGALIAPLQALIQPPPPSLPPAMQDWPLPKVAYQFDRSLFAGSPGFLLNSVHPPLGSTYWPLPTVALQPHRSTVISPLRALLNSIMPPIVSRDWPLPVTVKQPDRTLLTTLYPLLTPPPPAVILPPANELQDLPITVKQPDRSLFIQGCPSYIPCASFNHAYSTAYCGGVSLPVGPSLLTGLPIRVQQPDRTVLQATFPALIPCASFNSSYSDAYCGGIHPISLAPQLQSLPILVAQPDRSFFSSGNLANIPNLAVPPPGRGDFVLPQRVVQPDRTFLRYTVPSTISNLAVPPPPHQLSELPRRVVQPNRSFFNISLPIPPPANQPPPFHQNHDLPQSVQQPNRSFFFTPVITHVLFPNVPQFNSLQQPTLLKERTFDYTAFGRYPVLIPAPPVPPPHKHHLWNPPNTPGGARWTSPSDRGQLWTKVTSGNQTWQSKPIPNS